MLRDTGTVNIIIIIINSLIQVGRRNSVQNRVRIQYICNHRPGSGRPTLPTLKEMPSFFRSSCSLPLTFFCRLSGEVTENTFLSVKNTKSDILRELLKQKLSVLHVSNAVRVCQLMCTAPLETFQMHILTNNPGYRRPMNTHLP